MATVSNPPNCGCCATYDKKGTRIKEGRKMARVLCASRLNKVHTPVYICGHCDGDALDLAQRASQKKGDPWKRFEPADPYPDEEEEDDE